MRAVSIIRTASVAAIAASALLLAEGCAAQQKQSADSAAGRPVTAASTVPSSPPPTPLPTVNGPGIYVRADLADVDRVYVLRPGATTWTLVGDVPKAEIAQSRSWMLSPSGSQAVVASGRDLIVAVADGSHPRVVTRTPTGTTACLIGWNARSDQIIFARTPTKQTAQTQRKNALYTINADGTGLRIVPGATNVSCNAAISPDGSTIAFLHNYATGLAIGEYHEIVVADGARSRQLRLQITNTVHVHSMVAISPDGHTAVVAASTIQKDGTCDGSPDSWFVADLRTGRTTPLILHASGNLVGPAFLDATGRILATVDIPTKTSTINVVQVYDRQGRYLSTLPQPKSFNAMRVELWNVVA